MLTPYDKQQQARERQRAAARRELDEAAFGAELAPSCDWDAELAALNARPASDGPSPSALHQPSHGGYPRSGS